MKRIELCTKGMVLTCAALAFAFVGCTSSDGPQTGGVEATLTLDADASVSGVDGVNQHITTIDVTVDCLGSIDPVTGAPWPTEDFDVNVNTSEGNDPTDTKDTLGVFKKEGLPAGDCIVTLSATSDNGEMTCGGSGVVTIDPTISPANSTLNIIVNCTTIARYGGVGVNAEFNQCAEYSQIIVSPTTQCAGTAADGVTPCDPIDIEIWCYDPDAEGAATPDLPAAGVTFTDAGGGNCGDIAIAGVPASAAPGVPGYLIDCPSTEPPTEPLNPTVHLVATCALANVPCFITVGISEDGFVDCVPDAATNDNALAIIPVYCQGNSDCGDGIKEGTEECDVVDVDINGPAWDAVNGPTWCSTTCLAFDQCSPGASNPPASCPDVTDAQCQTQTCETCVGGLPSPACDAPAVDGDSACGIDDALENTPCDQVPGSGAQDWVCRSGNCEVAPGCTSNADCNAPGAGDDGNECTAGVCDLAPASPTFEQCLHNPEPTLTPCTSPAGGSCVGGFCTIGDCVNGPDLFALGNGEPDTGVVTACSTTAGSTDPTYCAADPAAPGGGFSTGTDNSGLNACLAAGPPVSTLSPECLACTGVTSCCTLNYCSVLVGGPCAGPPVPGLPCDLCIQGMDATNATCSADFTACSGLPYVP